MSLSPVTTSKRRLSSEDTLALWREYRYLLWHPGLDLEALIQSIDCYDPEKGATLEQYAWTRIHGAVLDELRRQDWAPRSVRRWERDMERAADTFTTMHGRRPNTEELADTMGIEPSELRKRRDEVTQSDLTSLNTLVLSDDETTIDEEFQRYADVKAQAGGTP